jgi:hypothetical protein
MNDKVDLWKAFNKEEPKPLWWDPFWFLWGLALDLIGQTWRVSVFIRKAMEKYGMYIGGALGGLITALIGKGIFILCAVNPDPRSLEYHTAIDWIVLGIIVGTGIGGYIGEIISSKLTSLERR